MAGALLDSSLPPLRAAAKAKAGARVVLRGAGGARVGRRRWQQGGSRAVAAVVGVRAEQGRLQQRLASEQPGLLT
jgi:hypothetical protein